MEENDGVPNHPKLVSVETDSARYHFYPALHDTETELPEQVYDSIDAMVIENSAPYDTIRLWCMYSRTQWANMLLSNYRREKAPIYVVDIPYSDNDRSNVGRRLLLSEVFSSVIGVFLTVAFYPIGLLGLLLILPLVFTLSVSIKYEYIDGEEGHDHGYRHGYVLPRVTGYFFLTKFLTHSGMRSVVAAEKLEEYVSSLVKDEIKGNRKPVILVEYGAFHLDIVPYLRHPHLRTSVLRIHSTTGYRMHDSSSVNQVLKYRFKDLETYKTAEFFVTKEGETFLERNDSDEEIIENMEYTKLIYDFDILPTGIDVLSIDFLREKISDLLRK